MATPQFFSTYAYPITLKPIVSPQYKEIHTDIFNLQNSFRILINQLDAELATTVPEAPEDGQIYGRKDRTWVVAGGGGSGGVTSVSRIRHFAGALTSTSAFAAKGIIFRPAEEVTITEIGTLLTPASTEQYKFGIATATVTASGVFASTCSLGAVVAETGAVSVQVSGRVTTLTAKLSSPVVLSPGVDYVVYGTRTDGSGTSAFPAVYIADTSTTACYDLGFPGITYHGTPRWASIATPTGSVTIGPDKYVIFLVGHY